MKRDKRGHKYHMVLMETGNRYNWRGFYFYADGMDNALEKCKEIMAKDKPAWAHWLHMGCYYVDSGTPNNPSLYVHIRYLGSVLKGFERRRN